MTALTEIGTRAQAAARHLGVADSEAKNQGLQAIAAALAAQQAYILAENQKDLERGRCKGLSPALLDRLSLNETRLAAMGEGLAQVWALSDPVGEELAAWTAAAGIRIRKVRVPLGVIGHSFLVALAAVLISVGISGLNEIMEFLIAANMERNGVGGYDNAMLDLIFNLAGAIVAVLFLKCARKKRS